MNRPIRFPYWLIIIILAAFAVGYWAWSESLRDDQSMTANSLNPLFSKEGAKGELERGEGGEFQDWQTYRNEEYGFEVKYPRNWEVNENSTKDDIAFNSQERIFYAESSGILVDVIRLTLHQVPHTSVADFRDFIKEFDAGFYQNFQVSYYTIQSKAVEHFKSKGPNLQTIFIDFNSEYILKIELKADQPGEIEIFDQILSTFKSIE